MMQLDTSDLTLLIYKVKSGNEKAYERLLGLFWPTLEAGSGNLADNPDWMQEARIVLLDVARRWDDSISVLLFDDTLYDRIQREAENWRYHNIRKLQAHEDLVTEDYIQTAEVVPDPADDPAADIRWIRYKICNIAKKILSPIEFQLMTHLFFEGKTLLAFKKEQKLSPRTVDTLKAQMMEKLENSPEMQKLWKQAQSIF